MDSLPEINERYESLFFQAPLLIAALRGSELLFEYYNPEFVKALDGRNLINQSPAVAFPDVQGRKLAKQLKQVFITGRTSYWHEFVVYTSYSESTVPHARYYDFTCSARRDAEGVIDGVMLFGVDVTAKAQTRRELAEQQLLFANITNAAGTALWMIDAHGQVTFVNQAWVEWTGRPVKAHLRRGWIRSVEPADRHRVIQTYMRQLKSKQPWHVDFRVMRSDNELQWVAASGKPRYLANGNFAGYVGSCTDITERKNAEQAAKDSQERFRLIADTAPVLIWMTAPDHRISFLNKQFLDYLGLNSTKEYPPDPLSEHIHPDDQEKLAEIYNRSFQQQEDYYVEYRIRKVDGSYRWIAMKGVPRYNENNVFKGYIGSGMDITPMKEHEQIKNEFIGMASHELKTPVTSIKAYVQLLLNRYKNAEEEDFTRKSLATVNKQIGRLTRLISDLLDVSKMDSGRLSLNLEVMVLNDVVKEAIDEVQHTTASHNIIYNENICCKVSADKDRIAQVVTNLLTNAIKYSPLTDLVEVTVSGTEAEVLVEVRDYGIGIKKEDQQKVFNRFYRVEGKNEQTFSGFGIGLFIAAEIIKRHNGHIALRSEQPHGTTFYFTLPVSSIEG